VILAGGGQQPGNPLRQLTTTSPHRPAFHLEPLARFIDGAVYATGGDGVPIMLTLD